MTAQTPTFRDAARRFAATLRSMDAVRRLATRLAGLAPDCRAAAELLDQSRQSFAPYDWVLECPLDDEHWERDVATGLHPHRIADLDRGLIQLGAGLVRLSQWLQLRFARALPPLPLPETFPPACGPAWKGRNAAALGFAAFRNATEIADTGPLRVIVAVADQCNFRCRTCYQSLHQDFAYFDISSSDLDRLGEAFRYAGTVAVGGFGEPLLSPAAARVLAAAKAAGAETTITTNGSLLERLAGLPPLDRIEISLDGASPRVLETVRHGARLAQITAGITALSDAQRANTVFNVVVNKLNVAEIAAIVVLARQLGLREVTLQSFDAYLPWHDDMRPQAADLAVLESQLALARAAAGPVAVRDLVVRQVDARATAVPATKVIGDLAQLANPKPARGGGSADALADLRTLLAGVAASAAGFLPALASARPAVTAHFMARAVPPAAPAVMPYCLEPFSTIVVKSDGSTNPCCKLDWNMGNINDRPVAEIWNGTAYRTLRAALITRQWMPSVCVACRDPNRSANLPDLVAAMTASGARLPRVAVPDDLHLPPAIAQVPQVRDVLQRRRPATKVKPPAPPARPNGAASLRHAQQPRRNELLCECGLVRLFGVGDIRTLGMLGGWAAPEEGHNWTDGPDASFAIATDLPDSAPLPRLLLEIVGLPYVTRNRPTQELTIYGNGFRLGFRRMSTRAQTPLTIPLLPQWWFVEDGRARMQLDFHLPNCARPRDMNDGEDGRELGFAFQSLCLRGAAD